jgi:hypothetical protein
MSRLYDNASLRRRSNLSLIFLALVILYGGFEFWNAWRTHFADSTAVLFGAAFIAGGIYGIRMTLTDARDQVSTFDADFATGRAAISLWRPFRPLVIETTLDALTNWRHYVRIAARNTPVHLLIVAAPGYPQPLQFELTSSKAPLDGLRRVAPEAVSDFERQTRRAKA